MATEKLTITVGGVKYPAYMTMGALRRYKRATGAEAATADTTDVDSAVTFLYCLTASACRAEGVPFDLDEDTFADMLLPDQVAAYFERFTAAQAAPAEKKTKPRRP